MVWRCSCISLRPMGKMWHLSGLNFICQVSAQVCNLLISDWSAKGSAADFIVRHRIQSSANSLISDEMLLSTSLIYSRKISGPRTVPWGTPERTGSQADWFPVVCVCVCVVVADDEEHSTQGYVQHHTRQPSTSLCSTELRLADVSWGRRCTALTVWQATDQHDAACCCCCCCHHGRHVAGHLLTGTCLAAVWLT